jgi:MFS family permease
VTCVLASSLSFVEGSVLGVALPAIRASYGAGAAEVQWVVNAYLLPLSALLLLGGALGDDFGRRRLLIIGTTVFAAASLLCALAPSLPLLLAGRALQGIGAALLLPNSLALLNAPFSGEERGRAVGIWAAAGAGAAAVAPLLGGWLVDNVGWPAVFYINLPLAAGAVALALKFVAESHDPGAGRTDYAGALLATGGLGGLTYALTMWSASGRFTAAATVAVIAGVVMLAAFLVVEHRRGALAVRLGPRLPLTAGPLVVAAGMLLAGLIEPGTSYWRGAFPVITVMAVGMAIAVAPLTSTVLGSVDQAHTGIASGFNSQVARIGGLIATALLGAVLASEGERLFAGFHMAMVVSAGVSAAGAVVALTMLGGARMKPA